MIDIVAEFLSEGSELLDRYQALCLSLETEGGCPEKRAEIKRIVHTLKGSGACAGFCHFAKTVHEFEDEIAEQGLGLSERCDARTIDRLLQWGDFFRLYLQGLHANREFVLDTRDLRAARFRPPLAGAASPSQASQAIQASNSLGLSPGAVKRADSDRSTSYPLYFRSYMAASRAATVDTAWAYLALSALSLPERHADGFAETVLSIVRDNCGMPFVGRVSLIRRLGLANQFEVVSSANFGGGNAMPKGSRCFVHPGSSLYSLAPGAVRIMDLRQGLRRRLQTEKAPHRAMRKLVEAHYQSGIAISLPCRGEVGGVLFLNSETDRLLDLPPEYLPILNMLTSHALRYLDGCEHLEPIYYALGSDLAQGRGYDGEAFANTLGQIGKLLGAAPILTDFAAAPPTHHGLFSYGNAAYLAAALGATAQTELNMVTLAITGETLTLDCALRLKDGGKLPKSLLEIAGCRARALGFAQQVKGEAAVRYSIALDSQWEGAEGYSV